MAKRNSTSKIVRAPKKSPTGAKSPPNSSRPAKLIGSKSTETDSFKDFGNERDSLMKAEAVLVCLSVSLNYYGWGEDDGTTYATAVDVARGLVQESMDRLEQRDRQIESSKRPLK